MNTHHIPYYCIDSPKRSLAPFNTIRDNQIRIIKLEKEIKISLFEAQSTRRKFQIENMLSPQNQFPDIGVKKVDHPSGLKKPSRSLEKSQKVDTHGSESPNRPESSDKKKTLPKFYFTTNRFLTGRAEKTVRSENSFELRAEKEKISHRDERLATKLKEIEARNRLNSPNSNSGAGMRLQQGVDKARLSPPNSGLLKGSKIVSPLKLNMDSNKPNGRSTHN